MNDIFLGTTSQLLWKHWAWGSVGRLGWGVDIVCQKKRDKSQALEGFCYLGLIWRWWWWGGCRTWAQHQDTMSGLCRRYLKDAVFCVRPSFFMSSLQTWNNKWGLKAPHVWVSLSCVFASASSHMQTHKQTLVLLTSSLPQCPIPARNEIPWRAEARPEWSRLTKMPSFQGRLKLVLTRIRVQHRRSLTQIPDIYPSSACPNYLIITEAMSVPGKSKMIMERRKEAKLFQQTRGSWND